MNCFAASVVGTLICYSGHFLYYRHSGLDPESRWNKESILNLDSGVKHQNDKKGRLFIKCHPELVEGSQQYLIRPRCFAALNMT